MNSYFISENMKIKHTFVNRLVLIAPLMVILFSVFLAADYFQVDIYNWWYALMIEGFTSLSCCLLYKIDGNLKNKSVLSLPIDLNKVWTAKVLVGVKNIAIASIVVFIAGQLSVYVMPINSISNISVLSGAAGMLVIIITSVWQVPLYLFLGHKMGIFLTVIFSLVINMFSVIMSVEKFWWINPFSYTHRLMCPILKLLPNGLIAKPGSQTFTPELLNLWSVPFGIAVSIILFILLTYLSAKWYEKVEAR